MASPSESYEEFAVEIQLADIVGYAAGGTRLIVEGERVYQAKHLLLVGVQTSFDDGLDLFASCLKSSSPSSEPHKIHIRTKRSFSEWTFRCSCKAGLGKCKHIMAVLKHLLLYPSIKRLTVTDMQQKWGKVAQKVANDMYKATKLSDFCSKTPESPRSCDKTPSDEELSNVLHMFLQNLPGSNLYYEVNGRPTVRENVENETDHASALDELLDIRLHNRTSSIDSLISIEDSETIISLKDFLRSAFGSVSHTDLDQDNAQFIGPLEANLHIYYEVQVCVSEYESLQICANTIEQRISPVWKDERSRRITASNAYSLYTYYNSRTDTVKDWRRKIMGLVVPKEIQSVAIMHGLRCESLAIKAYERDFNKSVSQCGFVIPPHMPWLGCSPDGIVINERKIIEVKCPISGADNSLCEVLERANYLTKNFKLLKRNHQYYAQVQLNMFILKCLTADFVIYSEAEDKCHVETINFDEDYVRMILVCLREVYFNAYLKFLFTTNFKNLNNSVV